MEQALEMMLYECNYFLKWGTFLLVIGTLICMAGLIAEKVTQECLFTVLGFTIGITLFVIGAAMSIEARYSIRKIEMYPEAAYYEYYNRDIDVNIKEVQSDE